MAEVDIDFEGQGGNAGNGGSGNGTQGVLGNAANGGQQINGETTDLNGGGNADITGKDNQGQGSESNGDGQGNQEGNGESNGAGDGQGNQQDSNSSTGELVAGDNVEFEGETYTVAENGDLVDKDGKVFKEAKDVKEWMESLQEETDDTINLETIQDAFGQTIVGEDGKPVEFTNDAAGVQAYVKAVVDLQRNEIAEGAVNKLYADNPLLKQFIDYVQVNGSPRGFGELPDRTGWQIDKDNAAQQETIVRMAAREFGNASLNDNYIKYLKDTGGLYDEAVNQLKALQDKDKTVKAEIEQRANAARAQEQQEIETYWNKVNDVINGRTIAGYKLPDSFVKEVDGKKQTLTPTDFYNYLSRQTEVDADGNRITGYQKDLANESDDDYLARELITAWLMFTGGTYKDLATMAIKENEVRTLKLKSKENRAHKTVKVTKPASKSSVDDIVLG